MGSLPFPYSYNLPDVGTFPFDYMWIVHNSLIFKLCIVLIEPSFLYIYLKNQQNNKTKKNTRNTNKITFKSQASWIISVVMFAKEKEKKAREGAWLPLSLWFVFDSSAINSSNYLFHSIELVVGEKEREEKGEGAWLPLSLWFVFESSAINS